MTRLWLLLVALGIGDGVQVWPPRFESAQIGASGWRLLGQRGGGSWSVPSRQRDDKHPTEPKLLFEMEAPWAK